MRDFDRRFNRMRRFVIGFIITVFVLIIGFYIGVGVLGVKLFSGEKPVSEKVGEAAKSFKDGFNKGFYGDSTQVDSIKIEE